MSTPSSPEGRRLDGPVRRVAVPPIAPTSEPVSRISAPVDKVPAAPAPVAESAADTPDSATFVYKKPKKHGWWRKVFLALGVLVLLTLGWFGFKAVMAARNIIGGSAGLAPGLANTVDLTKLKGEGAGRVNILFLGVGGAGHEGAYLSDTVIVISLDPKTKDVAMLSIPRDLYVKIPGRGYGKLNSANAAGGPQLAKSVVEKVIGVPIHYTAQLDFAGFKQAIDAVGGVDIDVKKALRDPKYPCDAGTKYANKHCPINFKAGPQHMNGAQALQFARSRESTSDFDRAARQQQVMVALRQKALGASTLTNPVKLSGLIDAIGSHAKTDLKLSEIQKLAKIAKDVDTNKITNRVLDTGKPDSLLVDGTGVFAGAGSIELPKRGNFDYSDIHDYVKNIFVDHYITSENARIEIQNGSGITGLAGGVVTSLKAAHYNVLVPTNADESYPKTVIYDYTNGKKPYTINYLEQRFGVKAQRTAAPSPSPVASPAAAVTTSPEIRIILGSDYKRTGTPNQ